MSFFNMLFGKNKMSDIYLATLGLTQESVGRFRDCWIEKDKSGNIIIAVYTRNGGGNRSCWHTDNPEYGNKSCKHHVIQKEVDEKLYVELHDAEKYPKQYNVFMGSQRMVGTGKRIIQDYYVCEEPNSKACHCPGCIIEYQLPEHPLYIKDRDDDFDSTYATIYFNAPEEFKEEFALLAENKSGDEMWQNLFDKLNESGQESVHK